MPTRLLTVCLPVCLAALVLATGCGTDGDSDGNSDGRAGPNAADRAFLQQMIPHHERAIAVARLGETGADDPRVRAFAARIVREQTPELARMRRAADGLSLDLAAGSRTAEHRITDAQVSTLRGLRGVAYDRDFLSLHIDSETGAAAMAAVEDKDGRDRTVADIAGPIATAPSSQIPELRRLLVALGG